MFDEEVYIARRRELVQEMAVHGAGDGLVLLVGGDFIPYTFAANPYPFRQDSSFLYYFGLTEPGLTALIDCASGRTTLVCDSQAEAERIWFVRASPDRLRLQCGADFVVDHSAITTELDNLRRSGRAVHYLPFVHFAQSRKLAQLLRTGSCSSPSQTLIACVVRQREVKNAAEIAEIEAAISISALMHRRVVELIAPGRTEGEIVSAMLAAAADAGAGMAYPPICTVNGHVLHNLQYDNRLASGDLLLVDAGAEAKSGYASDITRTHCVGDNWTDQQMLIRDAARNAQNAAAHHARPGVPMADVHRAASRALVEGIWPLGLFRGSVDAVIDEGAYGLVFPHGVGHLIGLDVHDMESLGEDNVGYDAEHRRASTFGPNHLRLGKRLREGMVITLEPGIYFMPELWKRWKNESIHRDLIDADVADRLMSLRGLRTEDVYVVESTGARRLGPAIA